MAKTLPRAWRLTFVTSACVESPSCNSHYCVYTLELSHICLQCGGKLQQSLSGSAVDVFSKTLRGLAATKLTKPSAFRTADGAGYAVRCSYKVTHTCCCQFDHQPKCPRPTTCKQFCWDILSCSMGAWNNLGRHDNGILETAHIRSCCSGNATPRDCTWKLFHIWLSVLSCSECNAGVLSKV